MVTLDRRDQVVELHVQARFESAAHCGLVSRRDVRKVSVAMISGFNFASKAQALATKLRYFRTAKGFPATEDRDAIVA